MHVVSYCDHNNAAILEFGQSLARANRCFAAFAEKPAPRKREVAQPRPAFTIENFKMETITPIPYDIIKEGLQQ